MWIKRIVLGTNAIAGTALYAFSFTRHPDASQLSPWALKIGVASGVSWVGFGLLLLGVTRAKPTILSWADACLLSMNTGMIFLCCATVLNFVGLWLPLRTHLLLLAGSDLAMLSTFIRQASKLRMTWPVSLAVWVGGLNGMFAAILGLWR